MPEIINRITIDDVEVTVGAAYTRQTVYGEDSLVTVIEIRAVREPDRPNCYEVVIEWQGRRYLIDTPERLSVLAGCLYIEQIGARYTRQAGDDRITPGLLPYHRASVIDTGAPPRSGWSRVERNLIYCEWDQDRSETIINPADFALGRYRIVPAEDAAARARWMVRIYGAAGES